MQRKCFEITAEQCCGSINAAIKSILLKLKQNDAMFKMKNNNFMLKNSELIED